MRPAALAVLLLSLAASAAPVPPPRQRPRPSPAGSWVAWWSGAEWPTVMLPDGSYVAERPGGPRYEGRWELRGNVLWIEERLVTRQGYGQVYRYSFTLSAGKLSSVCGGLRLVRAKR